MKVVPTGGTNQPKSMPTKYDEQYIKESEELKKIDYGKELENTMKVRSELMKLKNNLKKVCPPHEAMLRYKIHFKAKANPDNIKHVAI